ncbi:MAG: kynureninase [Acidimicrobiia bacterium]
MPLTRAELAELDAADPLAHFRDEFFLPDGVVYLDGNSLGALPKRTVDRISEVVRTEWGEGLIRSWHEWINLPRRVGDKIGRLIGADEGQVIVADSTSVNLFKLLAAALTFRPDRRVVLTEQGNFPTDVYMAQGLVELLGGRHGIRRVGATDLVASLDGDVAVLLLTHVNYQTGSFHDLAAVTEAAHAAGTIVIWDLSHTIGVVPVGLDEAKVDLAVGCGYKYLNGGPGAPAFLYVARRLQDRISPALAGWMGHASPFSFEDDYRAASGIDRHLVGTPPILSLVALEEAVDLYLEADPVEIRAKSIAVTQTFIDLVRQECGDELTLASDENPERRGSQVSLRHPEGYPIMQALIERGVIGDFRTPDILRFGFAPLYLSFTDVWDAVAIIKETLESRVWDHSDYRARRTVT